MHKLHLEQMQLKQTLPEEPKADYDDRRYLQAKELDLFKYIHLVNLFMGEVGLKHRLSKRNPNGINCEEI
jgi:hypothetical protein